MERYICAAYCFLMFFSSIFCQTNRNVFQINGDIELFYNFNSDKKVTKIPFLVSYNSIHSLQINLIRFSITNSKPSNYRFVTSFMSGTYAYENLYNEMDLLKYIDRLYVGFKLSEEKNSWIDVGVLPSHIGYEANYGKDNFLASRSITADNTPYFETGIRYSYSSENNKFSFNLNILNGWQNITYQIYEQFPAFGHQITFKPHLNLTLNSSSYVSYIKNFGYSRLFHNFFMELNLKKLKIVSGLDLGYQKNIWWSTYLLAQCVFNSSLSVAFRAERYSDTHNIIITNTSKNFDTFNTSLGLNYALAQHFVLKSECRYFIANKDIFNFHASPLTFFNTFIFYF